MKKTIAWHKRCLDNQRQWLEGLRAEVERCQRNYDKGMESFLLYERQIKAAEEERRDGFDSEKFLTKRKPAEAG